MNSFHYYISPEIPISVGRESVTFALAESLNNTVQNTHVFMRGYHKTVQNFNNTAQISRRSVS